MLILRDFALTIISQLQYKALGYLNQNMNDLLENIQRFVQDLNLTVRFDPSSEIKKR